MHFSASIQALIIASAAFAADARADAGDVYFDFNLSPEAAWITHPAASKDTLDPFAPTSMFAVKPALGFGVRRGFTNELHLGLGVEVAGATSLVGKGVQLENTTGDLLTAAYVELAAPASVGWRFDSGFDLSGVLELQAGPLLTFWGASALGDPDDLDDAGLPAKLPVDIADSWHVGGLLRAQALFEVRLWDVFVFAAGPSLGLSWADTLGVHVGLTLRPSAALGVVL